MHSCKDCIGGLKSSLKYDLVAGESGRYLADMAAEQCWLGTEPALQVLHLPRVAEKLPSYGDRPEYLAPAHCRLCFAGFRGSYSLSGSASGDASCTGVSVEAPGSVSLPCRASDGGGDERGEGLQTTSCDKGNDSTADANFELTEHLRTEHGLSFHEYREDVLGRSLAEWPQVVSAQTLRNRLAAFKAELSDWSFRMRPCASCARNKRQCKLRRVSFPPAAAEQPPGWLEWSVEDWRRSRQSWLDGLHGLLDVDVYLQRIFRADERVADAERDVLLFAAGKESESAFETVEGAEAWVRRVRLWVRNLRRDLTEDSVPAPGDASRRWLLHRTADLWIQEGTGEISCLLCEKCRLRYRGERRRNGTVVPHLPAEARANGLWHGPQPKELACLTYSEAKVINLARIYVSVKRIFLDRGSYARSKEKEAVFYHQKNVVAYPQNPDAALRALGIGPQMLAKVVVVQFVGEDRQRLRYERDLSVSVTQLRAAFLWLSQNSWPFMEATKCHEAWEAGALADDFEVLLQEYERSVGGVDGGTPAELVQSACRISVDHAYVHQAGPGDAAASGDPDGGEDGNEVENHDSNCAAALDGGVDDFTPVQLWDVIMRRYKVAQLCDDELDRLHGKKDLTKTDQLRFEKAQAVAEAAEALVKLHSKETREKLQAFLKLDADSSAAVPVKVFDAFENSRAPPFWFRCFVLLFARGDCMERCQERPTFLSDFRWAKCLLTRADFPLWSKDVEFVASVYNVFLRRSQIRAVQLSWRKNPLTEADAISLQDVTAVDLMSEALASGDVNSVKQVLRKKNLHLKLRKAFQRLQMCQRMVRGSEASRDDLIPKFMAMRVWNGCSSLFFTLNPHDIRSPISLMLLQGSEVFQREFSLDFSDVDTEIYLAELLQEHPRRLHELVASNPIVGARCFHWTVRLVVRTLFHCVDPSSVSLDSVPARETPGIFGYLRGFLGIVEPQMRKALHMHMLIQVLGFSHPRDVFGGHDLPEVFRRIWYYVASISFRSTEALGRFMHEPAVFDKLFELPLLPLTPKQQGMLGPERVKECYEAQMRARGMSAPPGSSATIGPMRHYTSDVHRDASVTSSDWAVRSVEEIASGTRVTGNHICRNDVCHKGRLGKRGFCRMYYLHWVRYVDEKKGLCAKMVHGLPLRDHWDGTGPLPLGLSHPFRGLPEVETVHPFHFKMTPGVFLGPKCNHDLGVLLRIPEQSASGLSPDEAIVLMLDAMGDKEFYCASYSSKEQPHIDGLLETLADGVRSKERDIAEARATGEELSCHEVARGILHRLMSATNRRMHKGFPEMLSYLLRKPMEYCSHRFSYLLIDDTLRFSIACVFQRVAKSGGDSIPLAASIPPPGKGDSSVDGIRVPCAAWVITADYPFRSERLERFPLYFFIAACDATSKGGRGGALSWIELPNEVEGGIPSRQRSYCSKPIESTTVSPLPLLTPGGECIHGYDYYLRLRLRDAWRVPVLLGKLPRTPDENSPVSDKGIFALHAMLLFRPHRSIPHFIDTTLAGLPHGTALGIKHLLVATICMLCCCRCCRVALSVFSSYICIIWRVSVQAMLHSYRVYLCRSFLLSSRRSIYPVTAGASPGKPCCVVICITKCQSAIYSNSCAC